MAPTPKRVESNSDLISYLGLAFARAEAMYAAGCHAGKPARGRQAKIHRESMWVRIELPARRCVAIAPPTRPVERITPSTEGARNRIEQGNDERQDSQAENHAHRIAKLGCSFRRDIHLHYFDHRVERRKRTTRPLRTRPVHNIVVDVGVNDALVAMRVSISISFSYATLVLGLHIA
jgi:hypothetical protein